MRMLLLETARELVSSKLHVSEQRACRASISIAPCSAMSLSFVMTRMRSQYPSPRSLGPVRAVRIPACHSAPGACGPARELQRAGDFRTSSSEPEGYLHAGGSQAFGRELTSCGQHDPLSHRLGPLSTVSAGVGGRSWERPRLPERRTERQWQATPDCETEPALNSGFHGVSHETSSIDQLPPLSLESRGCGRERGLPRGRWLSSTEAARCQCISLAGLRTAGSQGAGTACD